MSGEVRYDRSDAQLRVVACQPGRSLVEGICADVDRHVSRELRRRIEQQARLGAFSAAELHQCCALWNARGQLFCNVAQQGGFGTGDVIVVRPADLLEQARACGVVEVLRGQLLVPRRQAGDHVGGKAVPGIDLDGSESFRVADQELDGIADLVESGQMGLRVEDVADLVLAAALGRVDSNQRHGLFRQNQAAALGRLETVSYQRLRAACPSGIESCSALAKSTVTRAVMSPAE